MRKISRGLPPALDEEMAARVGDSGAHEGSSFLSRARHLIGSVEGPEDLSFNKKHMEGFGKSRHAPPDDETEV